MEYMVFFVLGAVFCIVFYMLPWLVAKMLDNQNSLSVFWINLCFGWSMIGWVVALVLALCTGRARTKHAN